MGNSGQRKMPSELVRVSRRMPVFTLLQTTAAPETAASPGSETVPSMRPVAWAKMGADRIRASRQAHARRIAYTADLPREFLYQISHERTCRKALLQSYARISF